MGKNEVKLWDHEEKRVNRHISDKRSLLSFVIILVVIPATIWLSWRYGDRNFYLVSLLIILYTLAPFFLVFERRRPQARELVILAVMCGIAVASRTAFIWLPHFKPMTAIVIIAGAAFGPEAGFLVGAVSGFVSNFIFGQGVWTPWQMFAFGVAGFLAGLLAKRNILKKKKYPMSVFGGVVTMLVVGPLLDTCTLFTMNSVMTWESAAAIYLSGVPVNVIQTMATVLTLLLVAEPMFEKLDRVKLKYGMMEE